MSDSLDVITIGRSSVDLYGAQIGGRLEDMGSFDKYIGGSPTNIACGTARLGLRSAVITGVGDEHMGRFIREQLAREGVNTEGVKTDPDRLTALVLLGIRDQESFPLIFYRENCADMGLTEADIDPAFIRRARAVVATGTHLSHPQVEAATLKALGIAREAGLQTALDIDYRPNLWGVAGHGDGESRFVESEKVTAKLQSTLHYFDLIVGTEEEFHIAGGTTDTVAALRAVRAVSDATLVCKRGAAGAVAFTGAIPDSLDDGEAGPGFPIEVFNVLGAGDGFMSGLLKGWLDGEDWPTALKYANACGAFAVSRHGCTPAYPSWEELQFFFERGIKRPDLRNDAELEQVHWATNRAGDWSTLRTFAFDHRSQLEEMAGYCPDKGAAFKELCLDAALRVADGQAGYGILCDNRIGRSALHRASGSGLWIGRPTELPGSRPIEFEPELGADLGGLGEWARENVVKLLVFCHADDDYKTAKMQVARVKRLFTAARRNGLEFLLEVIPSKVGPVDDTTTATLIQTFYDAGVFPDWWKLEPFRTEAAWTNATAAITRNDPRTRGIVVLGLDAPEAELAESFALAARQPLVKGFAVGRTIFGDAARRWFAGDMSDAEAVEQMAERYARLCAIWDKARAGTRAGKE
ncbi:5-dehydro-2-deoxygluconokinase [Ponticoccus sp. SC2-23]|uniref:bifunctional 5-dehydro-2-deoxygluconokinase/5-dehydro-2- deoxyphosphogluconate aldolase n=1 Tax=Alexandriicola marinus TaxID=2081710 RepID=UPI000FD9582E|nr:5-dehydro-2-deoxygluconokinase [Alexandriicola marinus]MBM1219063.1 5-dehydro-2-deoxygluconokinase [Ponticoccus sp. SC6-9]MBM1223865.1 5-dehydro-2-deoxygluconokinase [Ponticoccus sp. SC6-15]MBM1228877.1 5-dehydro-2-deoxygluconokinase [Ponticoccus sp. SC6-38]MBM1232831.1 5-dehydro-2-deoxygluconokinase [Ponticoccus sp. SC6-45]MBM1237219.1 5-dehydro-2-deoxygluconokinase [Ponticoccus sp. SC6-49]MBM1241842.1 5-dehydro-2-deoxygluconokinase [Ponticoccus sp. SC2-64]MBM1246355.1 5-dehydro-2-deoxyg